MVQSNLFQIENEIDWEDLGSGIKRQIFGYNDNAMLVKVKFELVRWGNCTSTRIHK